MILYPVFLLYIPAKSIATTYINTGYDVIDTIAIMFIVMEIIVLVIVKSVPALFLLQTFLMRISSLSIQFKKVHEYRIIPLVLMIVYVPIYSIVLGIFFEFVNDYWIYVFIITYTAYLIMPLICFNNYTYYLSWISGIASLIIMGYLLLYYIKYNIFTSLISSYAQCLQINLLVSDYINSLIMKNKITEVDPEFSILMKDLGYDDNGETIQLAASEIDLSNYKTNDQIVV